MDKFLRSKIEIKLDEINQIIMNDINLFKNNKPCGLFSGNMDKAIFLLNYYNYSKNLSSYNKMIDIIQYSLGQFKKGIINSDVMAGGLSGYLFSLKYFENQKILDLTEIIDLEEIDYLLISNMENYFRIKNLDFFYGGLGIGVYFISYKSNNQTSKNINKLLQCLWKNKVEYDSFSTYWNMDVETFYDNSGINLSLSHGQSSILSILTKIKSQSSAIGDLDIELLDELLSRILNLFHNVTSELKIKEGDYIIPNWIREKGCYENSRLAWCYGDLSNSYILFKAAHIIQNKRLKKIALNVALNTCTINSIKKSGVIDAGLCHGTAGIAHIYNRMYRYTKRAEFKQAANYWIEETLEMATHEDGLAGYKSWGGSEGWVNDDSLLGGISGIGLALLSHISNEEPLWDSCLLLN